MILPDFCTSGSENLSGLDAGTLVSSFGVLTLVFGLQQLLCQVGQSCRLNVEDTVDGQRKIVRSLVVEQHLRVVPDLGLKFCDFSDQ